MSLKKILVVDDDGNLLELIRMRLESAGYEVATALNEEEAIAGTREERFALSIVDLKLVQKDGISLMEEMHSIRPDMPVIILTAHGSIESAVEATKRGAFNYLNKPFDPHELLFQIKRAMENQNPVSEATRLEGSVTGRNACELKSSVKNASAITRHDAIGEEIVLSEKNLHAEPLKSFREAVEYFKKRCLVRLVEILKAM
jgi:two-component system response regulator GlrR